MKNTSLQKMPVMVAAVSLTLLAGCQSAYMARRETPLFDACTGPRRLAKIPALHSEPREWAGRCEHDAYEDEDCPRVAVTYRGQQGYARERDVQRFGYLHPTLDGGSAKGKALREERRRADLDRAGKSWPAHVREAVELGRISEGTHQRQELLTFVSAPITPPHRSPRERHAH